MSSNLHSEAMQDALRWIRDNSFTSYAGEQPCKFISLNYVRAAFTPQRIKKILESIAPGQEDWASHALCIAEKGYVVVFLILLQLNHPELITHFHRVPRLADHYLPFDTQPRGFPFGVDFKEFQREQQLFCALTFRAGQQNFPLDQPLPIVFKEEIACGASAVVSKIRIHHEFDKLREGDSTGYGDESESDPADHTYALKVFKGENARQNCEYEVAAYSKVRNTGGKLPKSLANCYGSYTYEGKYCMILEYAGRGTWREFMEATPRPQRASDILSVWEALLELGQALDRIQLASGWHQDINPSNIVVQQKPRTLGRYEIVLKLIDLRRSYFSSDSNQANSSLGRDRYGTKEYGAPETYRADNYERSTQRNLPINADVFSLGCIWLESAVWLVDGWNGVQWFRADRIEEAARINMEEGIAFFHDSSRILKSVDRELRFLEPRVRSCDPITISIRDGLVRLMLVQDSTFRLQASDLWQRVSDLWRRASDLLISFGNASLIEDATHGRRTVPIQIRPHEQQTDLMRSYVHTVLTEDDENFPQSASPTHTTNMDTQGRAFTLNSEAELESYMSSRKAPGITQHEDVAQTRAQKRPLRGGSHIPLYTGYDQQVRVANRERHDARFNDPHFGAKTQEIRELRFAEAAAWRREVEAGNRNAVLPHGRELKRKLGIRDHSFILDNSTSAVNDYNEMKAVFGLLAFIVADVDPDGLELRFTTSNKTLQSENADELIRFADNTKLGRWSNMERALEAALQNQVSKLEQQPAHTVRPISVYILTTGQWDEGDPEAVILGLEHLLGSLDLDRKQIGIQFISFGKNTEGLNRLALYDNMFKGFGVELDIVDTEPSSGNVWKMFFGAIDNDFDDSMFPQPGVSPSGEHDSAYFSSSFSDVSIPTTFDTRISLQDGAIGDRFHNLQRNHRHRALSCPHCVKTFLSNKDLRRHILTHTGEETKMDYACQEVSCRKCYTTPDNLRRHYRQDHPNLPLPPNSIASSVPSRVSAWRGVSRRSSVSGFSITSSHLSRDSGYQSLKVVHKQEEAPKHDEQSIVSETPSTILASQKQANHGDSQGRETLAPTEVPSLDLKHSRISAWVLNEQISANMSTEVTLDGGLKGLGVDKGQNELLKETDAERTVEDHTPGLVWPSQIAVKHILEVNQRDLVPIIAKRARQLRGKSLMQAPLSLDPLRGRHMVFSANCSGYIASIWVSAATFVNGLYMSRRSERHGYEPAVQLDWRPKLVLPSNISALGEINCRNGPIVDVISHGFAASLTKFGATGTSAAQRLMQVLRLMLAWCAFAKLSNLSIACQNLGEYLPQILGALSGHKITAMELSYRTRPSGEYYKNFRTPISSVEESTSYRKSLENLGVDDSANTSSMDNLTDYESCSTHSSYSSTGSCSCFHSDRKSAVLDALMQPFSQWIHSRFGPRRTNISYSSTTTGNGPYAIHLSALSSNSSTQSQETPSKAQPSTASATSIQSSQNGDSTKSSAKKRNAEREQQDDEEDDENRRSKQAKTKAAIAAQPMEKEFACPFYKRRPAKYGCKKACWASNWKSVHRLKCDHLYRHHLLPIRCDRCGEQFASKADRKIHSRQEVSCDMKDFTWAEGIDEEQEAKLRCRKQDKSKAHLDPMELEREKWFQVYKILFPDDDPDAYPSPYFERTQPNVQEQLGGPSETARAQLEDFMRFDLLAELRRDLAEAYDRRVFEASGELQEQFLNIARAVVDRRINRTRSDAPTGSHQEFQARSRADIAPDAMDSQMSSSRIQPDSLHDIEQNSSMGTMRNTTEQWIQSSPYGGSLDTFTATRNQIPVVETQTHSVQETNGTGTDPSMPQDDVTRIASQAPDQYTGFPSVYDEDLSNALVDMTGPADPAFTSHASFADFPSLSLNSEIDFDNWWQEVSKLSSR